MGNIKKFILKDAISTPMLNNRFTVECCENVHLHYRNLRLEFPKEEFLQILNLLKTLDENEIQNFEYGPDKFKSLILSNDLPDKTEFNRRLQIEEQVEGHYHLHYRNLRLEARSLSDFGIREYDNIYKKSFNLGRSQKNQSHFGIDEEFGKKVLVKRNCQIKTFKLNQLFTSIFEKSGKIVCVKIPDCPIYKALVTQSESLYKEYQQNVLQNYNLHTASWNRFLSLYNSIKTNGYDTSYLICATETGAISDGMHRACCLYNIYGGEYSIPVLVHKTESKAIPQKKVPNYKLKILSSTRQKNNLKQVC